MTTSASAIAISRYQTAQVSASDPGELLVALFDGLFRFLNVARHCLRNGPRGRAGEAISRSHAIVSELYLALDSSHAPELCRNLAALYDFSLARLVQANLRNDANAIDEVIRVLTPVREAFTIAVRQAPKGQRAR